MARFAFVSKFRRVFALFAAAALVAGCGSAESSSGSSGTEAGNGLKIGARTLAGVASEGARIEVWPWGQVPDLQGTAPIASATTDSTGTATIHVPDGRWSVLVRQGGEAFRLEAVVDSTTDHDTTISDTLRAMSTVMGVLSDIPNGTVSVAGLGRSVACDSNGLYRIDSLPSGKLALILRGGASDSDLEIEVAPGTRSAIIASGDTVSVVPTDTLYAWRKPTQSVTLSPSSYSATGAFAMAFRFSRNGTFPVKLFQWTGDASSGIKISASNDTLTYVVDGISRGIYGSTTFIPEIGIVWDGSILKIQMGSQPIYSGASTSLSNRSGWTAPVVGGSGIADLEWIATAKGSVPADWLARLPKD